MDSCRVVFTSASGQKIIIVFTYDEEKDELNYFPRFEPQVDAKAQLGLSGKLCEIFLEALSSKDGTTKD